MNRGTVIAVRGNLVTEDCITCGVLFAIPEDLRDRLIDNHRSFYCPNGHTMNYTGKTEAQKLKEQLERKERELAHQRAMRDQAEAEARHQEARARGFQGAAAKARKRAAKGVCPAPGCKRSFVDVARHVATCHPDLAETPTDA